MSLLLLMVAAAEVLDEGALTEEMANSPAPSAVRSSVRQSIIAQAKNMNASTGTPISSLRGVTQERAIIAAVGGGALDAGGDGMAGGESAISDAVLRTQLATYGIHGAAAVARILIRYAYLARAARAATERDQ